jgi:glycosyltransferase involved in cell wall biosynthesis
VKSRYEGQNGDDRMKIACVGVVKDEERYIAEWIAYQLAIGFDAVVLLDNGSSDRTKEIASTFLPRYDVRVFDWTLRTPDYLIQAYAFAATEFAGKFDWLGYFDTDEFLVLDEGASLKQVLGRLPDAAAVAVSWAMFGSSGHRDSPGGLVIENYLRRSPADFGPNRHVKSIIRPELMKRSLNGHAFEMDGAYVDLAGRPVTWEFPAVLAAVPDYAGGKVHHYFTRSWEDWLAKLRRGYHDRQRPEDEFYDYDRNEIFDDQAAVLASGVKSILASLAAKPKYRFSIAACARWETRYIVEWLEYHRAIGFDHVFLYCNDDDPAELFEEVAAFTQGARPFVTFTHHAAQGEQAQMYRDFLENYVHDSEWVSFFDIDEFLHLPTGERISDFMARFGPGIDCVLFNWIFFGPNGHKQPPDGPVLTNFTRRSGNLHPLTKYVAKSSIFTAYCLAKLEDGASFWHSPESIADKSTTIVNVLGEDARNYYASFEDASPFVNQWNRKSRILETAFVHHYGFRSERAFWERSERGLKGAFDGQTIWRELAESDRFAPFLEDVNGVLDRRLADFWQEHLAKAQAGPETKGRLKLGIAITTLNRRDMILNLVQKIRAFTIADYELIVCDDGSKDGSQDGLAAKGIKFIGGTARGIAWNKNRGIYYLLNVLRCDIIILMDDDIVPSAAGWEADWITSTWRYGHMNYALPAFHSSVTGGAGTAEDPWRSRMVPGTAYAFSRIALAQIGYLDVRFGRYGHEHSDFSFRALRAGFGGIKVREGGWDEPYFYVISGGLEVLPAATSGTQEELETNSRLLGEVANDPIYRHAWLTDEMRDVFLSEIEEVLEPADAPIRLKNHFASWADHQNDAGRFPGQPVRPEEGLANLSLRKPATQSSVSEWSRRPTVEQDAAGAVNGKCDGLRKFHTGLEDNPWWQVDLGGLAVIHEIRIYNTTESVAFRFKNFSLEVSIDAQAWVELARKEDDAVVGGVGASPFVWNGPGTAFARFVRITLLGKDYLHLDQVEVYGTLA